MICAFPPPGLQTSADYRRVMTFLEGLWDDFFSSASTVFPGDARRNMQCNENGPLYPRCMRFSRAPAGVATVGRWRSRLPSGSTEKAMSEKKVRVRCALRIQVEALRQFKSGRPVISTVAGGPGIPAAIQAGRACRCRRRSGRGAPGRTKLACLRNGAPRSGPPGFARRECPVR